MARVKVYTTEFCPYCVSAKRLLKEKNIDFEEINLEGDWDRLDQLKKDTGWRTVPMIFIDEELVGGFSELSALEKSGELAKKLS